MYRKYAVVSLLVIAALLFTSCSNDKKRFSTDGLKKYVEKMKQKQTYSDEKTKKALRSIFPKMKLD